MIRHSLNHFLDGLIHEKPLRFEKKILQKAITYLDNLDFHKRLRIDSQDGICESDVFFQLKNDLN